MMDSIFDLVTVPWTPDILDERLRLLVWRANTNGHLSSDLASIKDRPRRRPADTVEIPLEGFSVRPAP